jgi:5-methylcytosine-specific restriction endonuclease McrA
MPTASKVVPLGERKHRRKASSNRRGYDAEHRRQRSRILDEHPLCQICGNAFSTDLHHVDENSFNHAEANVLAVCEVCHHSVLHRR